MAYWHPWSLQYQDWNYAEAKQYAINIHFSMRNSKSKDWICARPKLHYFWTNHLPAFHPYQSDPRIIKSQNKIEQLKSVGHWSWEKHTDSGNTAGFRRWLTISAIKCKRLNIFWESGRIKWATKGADLRQIIKTAWCKVARK